MKRILLFFALIAAVSCNGTTQDNDPWGKIDDERAEEAAKEKEAEGKVVELSMYSAKMGQNMTYSVWLPREYDENQEYPFLYLLHGYEYGDQSRLDRCWLDKGNAASIANTYQKEGGVAMVIVMPNGLSSFYQGDYETYFENELMPKVEADYKCNGKRAIAGLSMGGYGTLYHALSYPHKFTYAYAMSPAAQSWMSSLLNGKDSSKIPEFTIEVGLQDMTVNNSEAKALYNALVARGVSCHWIERAGTHDWKFWQECLPKTLKAVGNSF